MLPSRIEIGDSVIFQSLGDEAILLNISTQQYYGLNSVGARMWSLLMESGDPKQVLATMGGVFEGDPALMLDDLTRLIQELLDAGLLRSV